MNKILILAKHLLFLLAFISFSVINIRVFSQHTFEKVFTNNDYSLSFELKKTIDDKLLIAGDVDNGFLLMKIDANGTVEYSKRYGGTLVGALPRVIQTPNKENLILAGDYIMFYSLILIKTDSMGSIIWSKRYYGDVGNIYPIDFILNSDGTIIILAKTDQNYPRLIKLDSSGNFLWAKGFGFSQELLPTSILKCMNGDYMISGWTSDDTYLIRTDTAGNIKWNKIVSGVNSTNSFGNLIEISNGNFICGRRNICKLDSTGALIFVKSILQDSILSAEKIIATTSDEILLLCSKCDSSSNCNSILIKTDLNLDPLWSIEYSPRHSYYSISGLIQTNNNEYFILKNFEDSSLSYSSIRLIKADSLGNTACDFQQVQALIQSVPSQSIQPNFISQNILISYSSISLTESNVTLNETIVCSTDYIDDTIKDELNVIIFPNPVQSMSTFLVEGGGTYQNLSVKIFDVTGRNLILKNFSEPKVTIDMSNYSNSIYFFTIYDSGKQKFRGKFIVHH